MKCLKDEDTKRSKSMADFAKIKREGGNIDLFAQFDVVEKDYQIGKTDCFKKYPQ